jgi:pyrroline-5-carboxylate reductase
MEEKYPTLCRVMPNTAIALGSSMTFISTKYSTREKDDALVRLFSIMGKTMLIPEILMPAATSLASCGIAFAMRYVRAAMEGGVELGFRPHEAQEIVCQTLQGAIDLLSQEGAHPEAEIDKVTTPGGLTIKGLNAMEECGFTHSVQQGLRASLKE